MEIRIKAGNSAKRRGILRLGEGIRFANSLTPLRMTVLVVVLFLTTLSGRASGATYYVSSSAGNDANNGTSAASAWQTIGHVNGQTFQPGDSILFKRGDVWNESLIPASSGTSGHSIVFDAYGTGAAPNLTGYYAVPSSAWVLVTGNAWKAPLPTTYGTINFCLFGSVWGQKVAAATANLTAQWDFYFANGYVYVYSSSNPGTFYNEPIVPMALSNVPVININGRSWLTFQHFLLNWFDQYGVYVQGTSDHLVFANMEADSMIPQGTQPLGFYVDEGAPGPGDIKIYNDEAHMNYDGFRFDGAATAITMVNDKAYANRDGALVDNTGAVSYSYCHFYASSLAVAGSTDVEWTSGNGPIAGTGNIAADTAPAVQVYQRYPAEITLTVDDAGMTPGADTYYASTVLPVADAAGVPVGTAITVGYPLAQTLISEFQGWLNAGRDVSSHSMSHTYYTNTDALDIQYTGSGTAASLSISNKTLTITVTGASDSVSYNLVQGDAQGTIGGLNTALTGTGKFTTSYLTPCQGPYGTGCSAYTFAALLSQDLADVSGIDVKTSVYHLLLDVTRLTTDEITLSRQWMTTNLTGLPTTPVYVYPGGYETTTMQGITEGVPYTGARGSLKEDLGVKDTYADGFNIQNITSFGVNPSWQGLQPAVLNQKIQALVWKEAVWGVPWGIFWHLNELTNSDPVGGTEITNLIQDFKSSGATIRTNTGLVNWLLGGTQETGTDGNYYYKVPATSMTLDFRPTKNSPVVGAGQNLGAAYALDINGVNQNSYGGAWEIGAHVYQGYAVYGEATGTGAFKIGGVPNTSGAAVLPQVWVNNHEGDSLFSYELELGTSAGTWITGPPSGCSFTLSSYVTTSAGLQSAVNAIEACRTLTGVGIALDIPPGLYSSANGVMVPQSASAAATNFLILRSTKDANLPNGQTVCAHGIQDNLATSTDIGIDNPDCAGDVMYYQLGTTVTPISAGAFTLANGTNTNTSNYNDVQYMWTVESTGGAAVRFCTPIGGGSINSNDPACTSTTIAPDHWLFEDMEARLQVGYTTAQDIVQMTGSGSESATSKFPQHIHFRKDWFHGDWSTLVAGRNRVNNAFAISGGYISILDSQCSQLEYPGNDHHCGEAEGSGPYKFNHNWFEGGASGCVAAGGFEGAGPSIFGMVPFSDVEFRRNRCTWPYAWLGQLTVPAGNTTYSGQSLGKKNIVEQKALQRVVFDGNIFENTDTSGGQQGPLGDWNVRNSSVGFGTYYQATITDLTFSNNILRNSCQGFETDKSNASSGNGGGVSNGAYRMLFVNNLIYGVSTTNPGCSSASSLGLQLSDSGGTMWQGTVTENSAGTAATFVANCSPTAGGCPGQIASLAVNAGGSGCVAGNLSIGAPNISGGKQAAGTYACSSGALSAVTLTNSGSGYTSAPTATLATGTGTVTVNMVSSPVTPPTGYQVLDINAGDPVAITMCNSTTGLNTVTTANYSGKILPNEVGPLASLGSSSWTGTPTTANLTVTYPFTFTANASDTSGYCTITNVQGGPTKFLFQHNTFITDSSQAITSNNSPNNAFNFQIDAEFRDSIILGHGWTSSQGEGTHTEKVNADITSLTIDHMVWPTRTASSYTEYGNNSSFPDPVGCTGAGCNPPTTMYFPATSYCTGATSTSACVGFAGAMSATSMPLTLSDYHNFALRSDSVFYTGNLEQASDGGSMGVNIPTIDGSETQSVYVCHTSCGAPGPFPD